MANNTPYNKMSRNLKLFGIIALLAVAVVAFSSCTKEKKIVGKWKVTKATGDFDGDKGSTWTFKDNGKCTIESGDMEMDGEWSISKDELTIDFDEDRTIEGYRVNIKGVADFDIDDLTNSEMSLDGKVHMKVYYNGSLLEEETVKGKYELEKK